MRKRVEDRPGPADPPQIQELHMHICASYGIDCSFLSLYFVAEKRRKTGERSRKTGRLECQDKTSHSYWLITLPQTIPGRMAVTGGLFVLVPYYISASSSDLVDNFLSTLFLFPTYICLDSIGVSLIPPFSGSFSLY